MVVTGKGVRVKGYIDGGPELAAKLAALEKGVRDELLVKATDAGAEVIEDAWRDRVAGAYEPGPGTAHYVDAIGHRSRPGKNGATAWVGLPNQLPLSAGESHPRDYAPELEFNHTPTLRPAFDESREKALDAMADEIRELLKEAI